MLDSLERANWPAKLHAILCVLHGHFKHLLTTADLLGGKRHHSQVQHRRDRVPSGSVGSDQGCGHSCVLQTSLLASLVHGGQRRAGKPGGLAVYSKQADAGFGPGCSNDQVGDVAIKDIQLGAINGPGVS